MNVDLPKNTDALDALVEQFRDPLDCLRELVQNALDAGSLQIDIRVTHADGVMILHFDDFGEGMDAHIIDTRLTRLFNSGKEGDLTKIGRFGIGFVSVFALDPDAVCVDTARDGTAWRVLFRRDRTFTRARLDAVFEGTQIRIIKEMDARAVNELRERARRTVTYWCRHADAEISFDGARIDRPFDLDAALVIAHTDGNSRFRVGYTGSAAHFQGFYNRGLTLFESTRAQPAEAVFPGVAFKVDSALLEHTLTRDTILQNDHFQTIIESLRALIDGPLVKRLVAELEADNPAPELLGALASFTTLPPALARAAFFSDPAGRPLTVAELRERPVIHALPGAPLAEALMMAGHRVVVCAADRLPLLIALLRRAPKSSTEFVMATAADDPRWAALREAAEAIGRDLLFPLTLAEFSAPVVGIAPSIPGLNQPFLPGEHRIRVLNIDDPDLQSLLEQARDTPVFAGYSLVKRLLLNDGLAPELDGQLLRNAQALR